MEISQKKGDRRAHKMMILTSRSPTDCVRDFNQRLIFEMLSRFDGGQIAVVWDRILMKQFNLVCFNAKKRRNPIRKIEDEKDQKICEIR
jgi:hypothetical protein